MADVAVVEADHPVAALAQQPAEGLVPVDHLGRQAHDQQHRLPVGLAELVVGELDPVGRGDPLAGPAPDRRFAHARETSHRGAFTVLSSTPDDNGAIVTPSKLAVAALTLTPAAIAVGCGEDSATSGAGEGRDLPQGDEQVELDPAEFTTEIDNPWWPMAVGSRWVYRETDREGTEQRVVVTVTPRTKLVANGVEAAVVRDVVTEDGVPVEVTDDWYAQDSAGHLVPGEDDRVRERQGLDRGPSRPGSRRPAGYSCRRSRSPGSYARVLRRQAEGRVE